MIPSTTDIISLTEILIKELKKRGVSSKEITKAKQILDDEESRIEILEKAKIDKEKIEKATDIKNQIQSLSNEIVMFRYYINESSKILGKRLFEDNSETSRISIQLPKKQVIDIDSLHIFIDDLHKYLIQSANWGDLYNNGIINPVLKIIERYRNHFNHIFDMKGKGTGGKNAYKELGKINNEILGHKIIKIEEFPILQINILEKIKNMLRVIDNNIEEWLG